MTSIGVCSWSLSPSNVQDLVRDVKAIGADGVQLALGPLVNGEWPVTETLAALRDAGITVHSGMMAFNGEDYTTLETVQHTGGVRLDSTWDENLKFAHDIAVMCRAEGIGLVSFHAGFIPHDANDPVRALMMERLRAVLDVFARQAIRLAFETGQETADTLLEVLDELAMPNVGVNFDPANMILYGMGDPVEALRKLAPHVWQIHIKDATHTAVPGTWGAEVVVGTGDVDWDAFFGVIQERRLGVDLMIEREAGDSRVEDMKSALALIRAKQ